MTNDYTPIEAWRKVWRDGFAPIIPISGLEALAEALRNNDPELCQGKTTIPYGPSIDPCRKACAISYAAWKGEDLMTVDKVENRFGDLCSLCSRATGYESSCTEFLSWFDDTPRDEMIRQLLPEVELAILQRAS